MNTDLMFSSKTEMWATPQYLFDKLNAEWNFTIDVCASSENAKCKSILPKSKMVYLKDGRRMLYEPAVW